MKWEVFGVLKKTIFFQNNIKSREGGGKKGGETEVKTM